MGRFKGHIYDQVDVSIPVELTRLDTKEKIRFMDTAANLAADKIQALRVQGRATHAARITKNKGLYLPIKMKQGLPSMYCRDNGGTAAFDKPILINHNIRNPNTKEFDMQIDPIGKIRAAEYIDTSQVYRGKSIDACIDSLNTERPFYQFIDSIEALMKNKTLYDGSFQGLGYGLVTFDVLDPDAIIKFLDGRYSTLSSNATTNKVICSICREDWTETGEPCEHTPGNWYDDDYCFLIAGDLAYEELSTAIKPADTEAVVERGTMKLVELESPVGGITSYDASTKDSIHTPYELIGMIQFTDSYNPQGGNLMPNKEELVAQLAKRFEQSLDPAKLVDTVTEEQLQAILDNKEAEAGDLAALFVDEEGVQDDPESEDPGVPTGEPETDAETSPQEEEAQEIDPDTVLAKAIEDGNLSEEEADVLYELMAQELDTLLEEGWELSDAINGVCNLEDAKLSSKQRKNLKGSTFCGPDRSFPINDCAHYTAGKRLLGRYKGSGDKSKILACIERKGRAMGCSGSKKESSDTQDKTLGVETFEDFAKQCNDQDIRSIFIAIDAIMTERGLLAEPECHVCPEKDSQIEQLLHEQSQLSETVDALRTENTQLSEESDTILQRLLDTKTEQKATLIGQVSTLAKVMDKELDTVEFSDSIAELSIQGLKNKYLELQDKFSSANIVFEDVTSNSLPDPLDDPTLNTSDTESNINEGKIARLEKITAMWKKHRKNSQKEAERYIDSLKAIKLVPGDFNIMDHVNDDQGGAS